MPVQRRRRSCPVEQPAPTSAKSHRLRPGFTQIPMSRLFKSGPSPTQRDHVASSHETDAVASSVLCRAIAMISARMPAGSPGQSAISSVKSGDVLSKCCAFCCAPVFESSPNSTQVDDMNIVSSPLNSRLLFSRSSVRSGDEALPKDPENDAVMQPFSGFFVSWAASGVWLKCSDCPVLRSNLSVGAF